MAWSKTKRIALGGIGLVVLVAAIGVVLTMKNVDPTPIAQLLEKKFPVQMVLMDGGRVAQLSTTVSMKYPNDAIDKPTIGALRQLGWETCVGPNPGWDSVLQDFDPALIHQKTTYLKKGMELLVISMRYESKGSGAELRALKQPSNDQQLVTVLQSNEGPLIYPKMSLLGVACP